jgi:hypothetical protein
MPRAAARPSLKNIQRMFFRALRPPRGKAPRYDYSRGRSPDAPLADMLLGFYQDT